MVSERQVCLFFCWEISKKVPYELKYQLSSHEILYSQRVNISDTPSLILIVAGYFLDGAYGDERCFTGEKRRRLKQQLGMSTSLGSQECISEKLREGEWKIGRACTFLSTRTHPECCYKISLILVMLYYMLTWLKTGLSKFELISMHSISTLQAMITNTKMSRLKCD